jgi:predicted aldo/keto reductase-like oxidoreductase
MFPINLAWDVTPGRKDAIHACALHNVGLVAMKPFAGSRLLKPRGSKVITPAQCLAYVLSQEGVSTAVPGVRNTAELRAALHVLDATDEEKDVRGVLADFQEDLRGNCLYCNHCLPCPVGIDIAQILRNVDKALHERSDEVRAAHEAYQETVDFFHPDGIRSSDTEYEVLTAKASSCTECGVCMKRCPFGVDVVSRMKQAVELFETEKGA